MSVLSHSSLTSEHYEKSNIFYACVRMRMCTGVCSDLFQLLYSRQKYERNYREILVNVSHFK